MVDLRVLEMTHSVIDLKDQVRVEHIIVILFVAVILIIIVTLLIRIVINVIFIIVILLPPIPPKNPWYVSVCIMMLIQADNPGQNVFII